MFLWALRSRRALKGRAWVRSSSPLRTVFARISSRRLVAVPVRGGTGVSRRAEEENSFLLQRRVIYKGVLRSSIMYFSGFQEKWHAYFLEQNSYSCPGPGEGVLSCCRRAALLRRSCLCCFSWPRDQDKGLETPRDHAGLQNISRERCSLERRFVSSPGSGEDCGDYLGVKMFSLLPAPHRETVTLSITCHCASAGQRRRGFSVININNFLRGGDKTWVLET